MFELRGLLLVEAILLPNALELLALLVAVDLFRLLTWLVVVNDEISPAHLKSAQMLTGALGREHFLSQKSSQERAWSSRTLAS